MDIEIVVVNKHDDNTYTLQEALDYGIVKASGRFLTCHKDYDIVVID